MKWAAFKFLTDENIQTPVVEYLQTKGFDILDVKQNGLSGSSDTYLLSLAYQQQRIVLTHDSDFGTLAFANHQPFWASYI
jgi:predicted nuclease of predicted toxin-antitoxin system